MLIFYWSHSGRVYSIYYFLLWPLPPTVYCIVESPSRMSAPFCRTEILGGSGTDLSVFCLRDFNLLIFYWSHSGRVYSFYYFLVWPLSPTVYCILESPPRMSAPLCLREILGGSGTDLSVFCLRYLNLLILYWSCSGRVYSFFLFSCLASSSQCSLLGGVSPQNVCPVLSDRDSGGSGTALRILSQRFIFVNIFLFNQSSF